MEDLRIDFKIVPENLEVIIGKSSVENLAAYPLVDLDYAIARPLNRLGKRIMDVFLAVLVLVLGLLPFSIMMPFYWGKLKSVEIWDARGGKLKIRQDVRKTWRGLFNSIILWWHVLGGSMTVVGTPVRESDKVLPSYFSKPGLTGYWKIHGLNPADHEGNDKYELYYLKNQSLWLDLEIIIKTVFR